MKIIKNKKAQSLITMVILLTIIATITYAITYIYISSEISQENLELYEIATNIEYNVSDNCTIIFQDINSTSLPTVIKSRDNWYNVECTLTTSYVPCDDILVTA